ncbi:CotY/CotZ family spore coat protein [Virgibacillus alimentarius]|uniref:Spore coat protein Z n=1 Tax=Virgibacillus alimentarius TaxID=698769 RepID=A0ABS4SAV9_9BACI|nr:MULTISPECIES: CotY/CotZ family spore coat protein [Virgibacillus]MBP2258633.1 spore coat protein Z [Virgibacillus alimentarius]HLR66617.1 CotY/CotZ family spore coat protein [Virgibacillus sp.]
MDESKQYKQYGESKEKPEECVKDVIRRIVKVQEEAEDRCATSCENSIRQLRKPSAVNPSHTTIPFILYCADTCKPFMGSGVFQAPLDKKEDTFFGSIETPIFRAKRFVKGSDNCLQLELLLPVTESRDILMPELEDDSGTIAPFFPTDDLVIDFQATGICIIVNLDHFLGITCLDPITPIPFEEAPESHNTD